MKTKLSLGRRGATTAVVAVVAIVLFGFAGFALDLTRSWMVSARLKTSVDAAALMAARRIDQGTRDAEATALFWVNWRRNLAAGTNYLGASTANPTITQLDSNRVQVSGTATVGTTLFSVIARQNVTVTEVSVATRQTNGLELAIVLDQTSSMNATAASGSGTKLQAAQSAVGTLLDILYAGADTQQNLWVSVVPFSRTVNVGTSNTAMLNQTGMPTGWSLANWSGCVEARFPVNDLTDVAPTTAPLRPYFWQSTYQRVGTTNAGNCSTTGTTYAYAAVAGTRYCYGDNDWGAPSLASNPSYTYLRNQGMAAYTGGAGPAAAAAGPNFMCALSPIQPLTASRATVQAAVNAITAPIRSGGTAIPAGLQGAWYTLSPNWTLGSVWQNPNPAGGPTLPMAYNTRNMRKAVIILTDGDNNWQPNTSYSANVRAPAASGTAGVASELLYSAYGRAATWTAAGLSPAVSAGNQTQGDAAMDSRTAQLCTLMKAQGILVYVIGFEVGTAAQRTMLQTCSSGVSQYYFESPTTAELNAAFTAIANQLSSLRLSE